jgi:hypothetical protein
VQFGLSKFLDQSVGQGVKVLNANKGRQPLDCTMSPSPSIEYDKITPEVVKVLMSHGANPNQKFEKEDMLDNRLALAI